MVVKSTTPPGGETRVDVGSDGRLGAGPRTAWGSGASQTGLTSLADGAATEPGIWEAGHRARGGGERGQERCRHDQPDSG